MELDYFLITERLKQIQSSFTKDGWLTIYESNNDDFIYCCLVHDSKIDEYKANLDWVIRPCFEGKPSFSSDGTYKTYSEDGYEPFIYIRQFSFSTGNDTYLDISEEFVLYFNLYERAENKQNRKYYFIDELGDLEEVINVEPKGIKIKQKYLNEYLAVRQLHFAICFDFMRLADDDIQGEKIEMSSKTIKEENLIYFKLIQPYFDRRFQSFIRGKKIISFDPSKAKSYHFDYENQVYESFITGYDENGNFVYKDCSDSNENFLVLTYFKKEVLNKYYNEPQKYEVDGWHVKSKFFSLKIDNNNDDYVAVFLMELGKIPHKEQLHWKNFNIESQEGISQAYYQTIIGGNWDIQPETPDLYFKQKFEGFNQKWEKKFGWRLYKPLAKEDEFRFNSLHIPTTNNIKSFREQILSLSIILIDRLNEEELEKIIEKPTKQAKEFKKELIKKGVNLPENIIFQDKPLRGISKFELFLKKQSIENNSMFEYLRMLYDLRSGLLAHSYSSTNEKCKKAIEYFDIREDNYVEVAKNIFIKSIFTLNTLENKLLNDEKIETK